MKSVMSRITEDGPLREVAILTRAVENVIRRLIRLLIGRMSLTKLQEMVRVVFVEEAEAKLKSDHAKEKVSLSRLKVLTGLDTRTLKIIRKQISDDNSLSDSQVFLQSFTPLFRLFDLWMNDSRYFCKNTHKPKVLKIEGPDNSFEQLVKAALPVRGITTHSVLERLNKSGIVKFDLDRNMVEIVNKDNVFITKEDLDLIETGLESVSNLLGTINHNLHCRLNSSKKYFQRGFWNYQLPESKIEEVRNKMHSFLVEADFAGRELMTSLAATKRGPDQITGGVGMFYYEKAVE